MHSSVLHYVSRFTYNNHLPQVLCYLNPGWRTEDGGFLRLHTGGDGVVDVLPDAGRLAMFYADELPHEVIDGDLTDKCVLRRRVAP